MTPAERGSPGTAPGREPSEGLPGEASPGRTRLRTFHKVLLAGVALVFLYHVLELADALPEMAGSVERGALWAILLMIGAVVLVLGVIGGGLVRAIRSESARGDRDAADGPGSGDGSGPDDGGSGGSGVTRPPEGPEVGGPGAGRSPRGTDETHGTGETRGTRRTEHRGAPPRGSRGGRELERV